MNPANEAAIIGKHWKSQAMLHVLQDYAPDRQAKALCIKVYGECSRDTEGDELQLVRCMASSIWDGVAYGNWLWITV